MLRLATWDNFLSCFTNQNEKKNILATHERARQNSLLWNMTLLPFVIFLDKVLTNGPLNCIHPLINISPSLSNSSTAFAPVWLMVNNVIQKKTMMFYWLYVIVSVIDVTSMYTYLVCEVHPYYYKSHEAASCSCKSTNQLSLMQTNLRYSKNDGINTFRWTKTYTHSPEVACMHGGRRQLKLRRHTTLFITSLTPGKYHNTVWVRTSTPPLSLSLCQQRQWVQTHSWTHVFIKLNQSSTKQTHSFSDLWTNCLVTHKTTSHYKQYTPCKAG